MAMSEDHDDDVYVGFMWENQSWSDILNSENIGESNKQKVDMKSLNHKKRLHDGEVLGNKKRSRGGGVIRSENDMNGEVKDEMYRDLDHEMHILTERERRKKMRNMFSGLHALLPELPSKADKYTIVDATVKKIKNLQNTIENLEKKKQEKLKCVSVFGSESSSVIKKSHWHPYESRETIITDHGSSSYNDNFPTSEMTTSFPNSKALAQSASPPHQVAFQTWSYQNVVLNIRGGEAQFCICATKMLGLLTRIAFVLEKYRIDVISASITCNENGKFYMIQAHARQCLHDSISMEETYKQAAREIMMWIS
ncbi:transcription factor bHLH95-like [Vicia villosa]|uniref:transcription factor bHLH95-like n=1 Tax=Vicia villosa TaxID=3911 RepID=UPI00273AB2D3|nr:transcription factor bHLH95-like [Vicia villosa]